MVVGAVPVPRVVTTAVRGPAVAPVPPGVPVVVLAAVAAAAARVVVARGPRVPAAWPVRVRVDPVVTGVTIVAVLARAPAAVATVAPVAVVVVIADRAAPGL